MSKSVRFHQEQRLSQTARPAESVGWTGAAGALGSAAHRQTGPENWNSVRRTIEKRCRPEWADATYGLLSLLDVWSPWKSRAVSGVRVNRHQRLELSTPGVVVTAAACRWHHQYGSLVTGQQRSRDLRLRSSRSKLAESILLLNSVQSVRFLDKF